MRPLPILRPNIAIFRFKVHDGEENCALQKKSLRSEHTEKANNLEQETTTDPETRRFENKAESLLYPKRRKSNSAERAHPHSHHRSPSHHPSSQSRRYKPYLMCSWWSRVCWPDDSWDRSTQGSNQIGRRDIRKEAKWRTIRRQRRVHYAKSVKRLATRPKRDTNMGERDAQLTRTDHTGERKAIRLVIIARERREQIKRTEQNSQQVSSQQQHGIAVLAWSRRGERPYVRCERWFNDTKRYTRQKRWQKSL